MKILDGEDKQLFIDYRVRDLVSQIQGSKPLYFSLKNLDYELISPLIEALHKALIFAERDGYRLRLAYLKEE